MATTTRKTVKAKRKAPPVEPKVEAPEDGAVAAANTVTVDLMQFNAGDRDRIAQILGVPHGQTIGQITFPEVVEPDAPVNVRLALEQVEQAFRKLWALQASVVRTDLAFKRELGLSSVTIAEALEDIRGYQRVATLRSPSPRLTRMEQFDIASRVTFGLFAIAGVGFAAVLLQVASLLTGR